MRRAYHLVGGFAQVVIQHDDGVAGDDGVAAGGGVRGGGLHPRKALDEREGRLIGMRRLVDVGGAHGDVVAGIAHELDASGGLRGEYHGSFLMGRWGRGGG